MTRFGPYMATADGNINYVGNKIFPEIQDVKKKSFKSLRPNHILSISKENFFKDLSKVNNTIYLSLANYFDEKGAIYVPLPQTTQMFSSLGAVSNKNLEESFLGSVVPIAVNWFDNKRNKYLAESAQIYLELSQAIKGIDNVWTISNTFRGENADYTHLPEFHHVEYEGVGDQESNINTIRGMLKRVIGSLLERDYQSLETFLEKNDLNFLDEVKSGKNWHSITFEEAFKALREETKDDKYVEVVGENFGAWEEIRLTEIFGGLVEVSQMPLDELPFFHTPKYKGKNVADNTDFILPGYRETVGSGRRVKSREELEKKLSLFNLPVKEYESYLKVRELTEYGGTSGFGLGWERLTQGLLHLPFIWSSMVFPRGHDDFDI